MAEQRIENLARLLIEYSLGIKRGQTVRMHGHVLTEPLLKECYRLAVRRGAHVMTNVHLDGLREIFFKEASREQLEWVSPFEKYRIRRIDAELYIGGGTNTRSLSGCDPKKMAARSKAQLPLEKLFMKRAAEGDLKWVYTHFPTHSGAQDADMSLADYEEFVFGAGHLDDPDPIARWKQIAKSQAVLSRKLNKVKEVRIVAEDTDITFSCEGRTWINCDGKLNFPDGEVFTSPVEDSVNGHIRFSFPAVHHGREVQDVQLEFKNGKVVGASASKDQAFLQSMIDMDRGSCRLGEAAIGTNYNIQQFTRNTLFDEKIGGTIHLALGAAYPETGGKNHSGLHWDMVCDMRRKGKLYADGTLIQEKGKFLAKTIAKGLHE